MRIVGGALRGRSLTPLGKGDAGAHLRPTSDRVRESLFNVLAGGRFGDPVTGAQVLDLFAGTGALGLEALSRGAAQAVFVDDGRVAQRLIARNIALLGLGPQATVIGRDATRLGPYPTEPCDLIFLDPPYGKGLGERALARAVEGGWLAPGALVIWEESRPVEVPEGFAKRDERRYGDTIVSFVEAPR